MGEKGEYIFYSPLHARPVLKRYLPSLWQSNAVVIQMLGLLKCICSFTRCLFSAISGYARLCHSYWKYTVNKARAVCLSSHCLVHRHEELKPIAQETEKKLKRTYIL